MWHIYVYITIDYIICVVAWMSSHKDIIKLMLMDPSH